MTSTVGFNPLMTPVTTPVTTANPSPTSTLTSAGLSSSSPTVLDNDSKFVSDMHAALHHSNSQIKTLTTTNRILGARNEKFKGENRVLREVLTTRNTNWAEGMTLHELASSNEILQGQVLKLSTELDKTKRELADKTVNCIALAAKGNKTRAKYHQAKDEIERLLNENELLVAQKDAAYDQRDAANLRANIAENRANILEESLINDLIGKSNTRNCSI